MLYKAIIQGNIEFGSEKSFSKAVKMYEYRAENYHKSDALFETEEIFFKDSLMLNIPRFVKQVFDKTYKNTIALLEYCSQFGVSGEIDAWLIEEGKVLKYDHMEPNSDKIAVQRFLKGRALMDEEGKEEQALEHLTKAIEKYDRHAQAYQKRAKVNKQLQRNHDAMRDYTKSIGIDPSNPYAYYGRAKILLEEGKLGEAIADLEEAIKKSVALQPVYWKARRNKGKAHFEIQQYEKAAFDLKLFSNRKFDKGNPNIIWKRWVSYYYGEVLLAQEEYDESIKQFDAAMEQPQSPLEISDSDILRQRGIAKWKSGVSGHIKDWTDASELGDKQSQRLLKENS